MSTLTVTEKPILFSGPMVRAILEGRKTQTRRVVKPQPIVPPYSGNVPLKQGDKWTFDGDVLYPPHPVGSRMWVRETWQAIHCVPEFNEGFATGYADDWFAAKTIPKSSENGWWVPIYKATDSAANDHVDDRGYNYRPSIHMPKWASRITLEVTDVRVERLQEIIEEDAIAEGIERLFTSQDIATANPKMRAEYEAANNGWRNYLWHGHFGRNGMGNKLSDSWPHQHSNYESAVGSFSSLWASINGPDSWQANPWVWAYTFKAVQ